MDDVKQLKELKRKSLTVKYSDIRIVDDGYRVTVEITKQGSNNIANFMVTVPQSGMQARARRWDKTPEQIKEDAQHAVASFGETISSL